MSSFMLLDTLGVTLLGNMLTDKRKIPKRGVTRDGKGNIWAIEKQSEEIRIFNNALFFN